MKKFTLFFLFAVLSMSSVMAQKPKFKSLRQHEMALKSEIVKPEGDVSRTASPLKAASKAPYVDAKGFITKPEGVKYEYQVSYNYDLGFGTSVEGGLASEIWYDEATRKVYIKDIIPFYNQGFYVEGTLVSGDLQNGEIEFENMQKESLYNDEDILYAVAMFLNDDGLFEADTEAETYTFNIHDGIIDSEDVGLCLMREDGRAYEAQAYMEYRWIDPATTTAATVPDGAVKKYYSMTNGNDGINYWDGNDVYFTGLFSDVTLKGQLRSDNKIAITTPQFAGKFTNLFGSYYRYFNTGSVGESGYVEADPDGELLLDYDPTTGTITAPDDKYLIVYDGINIMVNSYTDPSVVWTPLSDDKTPVALPSDATVSTYAMNSEYNGFGYHQGGISDVCLYGDSVLYISRCDGDIDNFLLKATVNKSKYDPSSNVIPFTVTVGSPVGYANNHIIQIYSGEEIVTDIHDDTWGDYKSITYNILDGVESVDFKYNKTTKRITTDDILVFSYQGYTFSYALYPEFYPVENITSEHEGTSEMLVYNEDDGQMNAKVAGFDAQGDTRWIILPATDEYPTLTLQGTLSNGKLTMKVPQLVNSDRAGYFLRSGYRNLIYSDLEGYSSYSWYEWEDNNVSEITCDYDAATGKITFPDQVAVVGINKISIDWPDEVLCNLSGYVAMPYTPHLATPAAPYDLELDDPSQDYWGGQLRWSLTAYIPNLDVDGNYLDYDSITYRLYFDDEPFVFDPETYYPDFTENTIDVPFNNEASISIPHPYWSDNARIIYLNSIPEHKLGIQSAHHFNGERADSEITWYDVEGLSVNAVNTNSEIRSTEWYDLTGRRVEKPQTGIYIQRTKYADGQTVAHKVVKK